MTRAKAESDNHAGQGPSAYPELDKMARLNAQMLPPEPGMLECDRHSYPSSPQRLHKGSTPTGGNGGGHLHQNATR